MLNSKVNEGSTAYLQVTFIGTDGKEEMPQGISYTIEDYESKETIVDSSVSPAEVVQIKLTPEVNTLRDSDDDIRVVTVTANYGTGDKHIERFMYEINKLGR